MEFVIGAIIVAVLSLAIFICDSKRLGKTVNMILSAAMLPASLFTLAIPAIFQAFLLFVISWLTPPTVSRKTRALIGTAVTLAVFGYWWIPGLEALVTRHRLRQQYPVESLAARLESEAQIVADPSSAFRMAYATSRNFSSEVTRRLLPTGSNANEMYRSARSFSHREWQLQSLHNDEVIAFMYAAGFGVGRMFEPETQEVNLVKLEPLPPLSDKPESESFITLNGTTIRNPAFDESAPPYQSIPGLSPGSSRLRKLHEKGSADFIPEGSLGYTPVKQRASGFVSHQFARRLPNLDAENGIGEWVVSRLELVSLLKFKEPRVYISNELPQMDKLKTAPTRPLNAFEDKSLSQLWTDRDVVVKERPARIWMLGAIRADTECLSCHSVKRGQLLGAFSYELRPHTTAPDSAH